MLISYKLGQSSVVLRVKLRSTTAPYPGATALTNASSGLRIAVIADNEAATTAYTSAGSNVETISTLGTYAAPTSGKCRFKEVDATSHPGLYEIQVADARFAVSSSKSVVISITGLSGVFECDAIIPLTRLDPYDAVRGGWTALPNAAAETLGGLITRGTGTGQMAVLSGGVSVSGMANGVILSTTFDGGALDAVADRVLDYSLTNGAAGGMGAILLDIAARLPAALVGGRMDVSVGAMAANVVTASALASDAASEVATAVVSAMDSTSTALASLASGQSTINSNVLAVGATATAIYGETHTTGVKVADKAGYSLSQAFPANFAALAVDSSGRVKLMPAGMDDVSTAAPSGVASNFREMQVQTWRRFHKKTTLTATQLRTYGDDGTTVLTTQAASDDGTTQALGAAT